MRIWKWPLQITDRQAQMMPAGAEVLTVQMQGHQPQLWALVDPEKPRGLRHFQAVATGEPFDDEGMKYVATFQINGGSLVFHLFELMPLTSPGNSK